MVSFCRIGDIHPPPALGFSFPCALLPTEKHIRGLAYAYTPMHKHFLSLWIGCLHPSPSQIQTNMENGTENGVAIRPVSEHVMKHTHTAHTGALPWLPQ